MGALAPLAASADDITPPAGDTPVVGMARERGADTLWIAGPRADKGVIVNAKTGAEVTWGGKPTSVQALAWHASQLYIGDIGDAEAARDHVVVFRLGTTTPGHTNYNAFDFTYEDGAHDAKAFAMSGRGNFYVVTTGTNPGVYYAASQASRTTMNTLRRVADAPAGVTDAVFLSDGSTLALRTDTGIEYLNAFTWETLVTDTLVGAPKGESITVDSNDAVYVGGNPAIRTTAVPSSNTTTTVTTPPAATGSATPSPDPSPSASASPSSSAEPDDEVEAADATAPSRTGTYLAIGLAAVLALTAGCVTYFVRN